MVDSIIVGQFIGEEALAAVGSTGSMVFLVNRFLQWNCQRVWGYDIPGLWSRR